MELRMKATKERNLRNLLLGFMMITLIKDLEKVKFMKILKVKKPITMEKMKVEDHKRRNVYGGSH